jgi:hypothetical protein
MVRPNFFFSCPKWDRINMTHSRYFREIFAVAVPSWWCWQRIAFFSKYGMHGVETVHPSPPQNQLPPPPPCPTLHSPHMCPQYVSPEPSWDIPPSSGSWPFQHPPSPTSPLRQKIPPPAPSHSPFTERPYAKMLLSLLPHMLHSSSRNGAHWYLPSN